MNDWNIQTRAYACQSCGKPFADKQVYHTVLFANPEGPQRQDICGVCWKNQLGDGATERKGFISYWHGVYEAPPPTPAEPLKKETAEDLLRKLIETNDPKNGPACYILAVMLERKRILKVKEQIKNEGRRVFVYEHAKTGDIFTITDPNLHLHQLDQLQRDLTRLLEYGLEGPPIATVTAADPASSQESSTSDPPVEEKAAVP